MSKPEVITKNKTFKKANNILYHYLAHNNLLDVSDILQDAQCAYSESMTAELEEAEDKYDFRSMQVSLWEYEDILTDLIEFINALRTVQLSKYRSHGK